MCRRGVTQRVSLWTDRTPKDLEAASLATNNLLRDLPLLRELSAANKHKENISYEESVTLGNRSPATWPGGVIGDRHYLLGLSTVHSFPRRCRRGQNSE